MSTKTHNLTNYLFKYSNESYVNFDDDLEDSLDDLYQTVVYSEHYSSQAKEDIYDIVVSESTYCEYFQCENEFPIKEEKEEKIKKQKDEILCDEFANEKFCHYCKYKNVIPISEKNIFIEKHFENDAKTKKAREYLFLVFRLCPRYFENLNVMGNKHLRKYIFSYLNEMDVIHKSPYAQLLQDNNILCKYYNLASASVNEYVYEVLFHQPNLTYFDYTKCDFCEKNICPKHSYLSNHTFFKCSICNVHSWSICGWCKPFFDEVVLCNYKHKKHI